MLVSCACCGARHSLDALITDAAARRALARIAELGDDLTVLVIAYAGCHRPARRVLSWTRFTRLVDELHDLFGGAIRRKGRSWTVTRAQWTEAMRIVVERRDAGQLDTPLKGHGYLLEVARGLSGRAEAAAETAVETARREGRGPERVSAADHYETLLADAMRLGVAYDSNGLIRRAPELAEAVEQARQQEEST